MKDKQISYNLRKPFDLIDSLNKKTPPKIEGVAIGETNVMNLELLFDPEYYMETLSTYKSAKAFLEKYPNFSFL